MKTSLETHPLVTVFVSLFDTVQNFDTRFQSQFLCLHSVVLPNVQCPLWTRNQSIFILTYLFPSSSSPSFILGRLFWPSLIRLTLWLEPLITSIQIGINSIYNPLLNVVIVTGHQPNQWIDGSKSISILFSWLFIFLLQRKNHSFSVTKTWIAIINDLLVLHLVNNGHWTGQCPPLCPSSFFFVPILCYVSIPSMTSFHRFCVRFFCSWINFFSSDILDSLLLEPFHLPLIWPLIVSTKQLPWQPFQHLYTKMFVTTTIND